MKQANLILAFVLLATAHDGMTQQHAAVAASVSDKAKVLSVADRNAVKLAIVDEMYAHDLQGYVPDISRLVSGSEYKVRAYFDPKLHSGNVGWVIYKLMPYGEVLRMFTIGDDGFAFLYGKLRNHFPPTEPSYLTVYMDDDDLCQIKQQWLKEYFLVDSNPSATRVTEARARERKRNSLQ